MVGILEKKAPLSAFQALMKDTNDWLNADAASSETRRLYYAGRGGSLLEDDVTHALNIKAAGTVFQGKIKKVSGQRFPDIIAAKYYGVEVKSTASDHWKSTGSSILESTRVSDVERIYMTFGKLGGKKIEFISRPYEECLSGIAVTHMPRYLIDMELAAGSTIFDKMGVSYEELRKSDNPVRPVAHYYQGLLKPGERLWWADYDSENTTSAAIRLFRNLKPYEKTMCKIYACVNFPEIFCSNYDRYVTWLASKSIVDPSVRDQFSAGGKEPLELSDGTEINFPGIFRRIKNNKNIFYSIISKENPADLSCQTIIARANETARIKGWCEEVAKNTEMYAHMPSEYTIDALHTLLIKNRWKK